MSATGQRVDLTISQGVDFSMNLPINDDGGNSINLSGYSGFAPIGNRLGEGTGTSGLLGFFNLSNPSSGIINLSLTSSFTINLPTTQGVYDLTLMNPSGAISKYYNGYVNIWPATFNNGGLFIFPPITGVDLQVLSGEY